MGVCVGRHHRRGARREPGGADAPGRLARASVEAGRVGLPVVALELLEGVVRALQLLGDAGAGRDGVGVPRLGLPQLAAQERLAAVEEHLLDVDLEREHRAVALDDELVEPRRVADQPAVPLTRSVSVRPGMRKIRPTCGLARMLR